MSYEIHLERIDGSKILLKEWCAAVEATDGLRLATADTFARNPTTGEKFLIPRAEGDVEIYFPANDVWIPGLRFSAERNSFHPGEEFMDEDSTFRRAILALATLLHARVVGDEGEVYS